MTEHVIVIMPKFYLNLKRDSPANPKFYEEKPTEINVDQGQQPGIW